MKPGARSAGNEKTSSQAWSQGYKRSLWRGDMEIRKRLLEVGNVSLLSQEAQGVRKMISHPSGNFKNVNTRRMSDGL